MSECATGGNDDSPPERTNPLLPFIDVIVLSELAPMTVVELLKISLPDHV
jgi:hypothetical protein